MKNLAIVITLFVIAFEIAQILQGKGLI